MPRGTVVLQAWEARVVAERESVVVTARCAWCPWELEGTVLATREAHRQHRETQHPDIEVRERRKRHRPARQFTSAKNLDTNIENARQQGAAGWAGPT